MKTNHDERAIAFELTGGKASDAPTFATLIDAVLDKAPRAVVGDTGYDSDVNQAEARDHGAVSAIPHRSNQKSIPALFARALCQGRARIQQMIGKLNRFKCVARRCEKTACNVRSFVSRATAFV